MGVHIGRVTRVAAALAWVELPEEAPGFEFGPCRTPAGVALVAGDDVACAFLGDGDDVVVLTRLA